MEEVQSNEDSNNTEESTSSLPGEETPAAKNAEIDETQEPDIEQHAIEYKDHYLRAAAELENCKRRFDKERSDLINYGMERFMNDMLPILDSVEKAIPEETPQQKDIDNSSLLAGVELIKKQLQTVLEKHGLKALGGPGDSFDPNLHQAIQRIDAEDVEDEKVAEVFQKGYSLNGRLIRAAMVSVKVPKN